MWALCVVKVREISERFSRRRTRSTGTRWIAQPRSHRRSRRSNWNLKPGCLEPESMSPTPDTLAPQLYHTPDDLWHVQDCVTYILNVTIPIFSFCVTLSLLGRQQRGEGKCWMSLCCILVKKDMKVWSWQCPQSVRKGVGDRKAWEIFWLITFYHIL